MATLAGVGFKEPGLLVKRVQTQQCPVKKVHVFSVVAVEDARKLRKEIGAGHKAIETDMLFDLLGIAASDADKWNPAYRSGVSVGIPEDKQKLNLSPAKTSFNTNSE